MRAAVANLAPLPRRAWAEAAVNRANAAGAPVECTFVSDAGHRFRAVRGADRGLTSTVFRIHATLEGHQLLAGRIEPEAHPDAADFRPHPWVVDDVPALLPKLTIGRQGGRQDLDLTVAQLVATSPAHQRFRCMGVAGGFRLHWYADLLHDDPVIQVKGLLKWTDRTVPDLDTFVDGIAIESGEFLALDYGRRNGCTDPVRHGAKWVVGLCGNLGFIDGSALPLVGRMPCFRGPGGLEAVDDLSPSLSGEGAMDLSSLHAATKGPVLGLGLDLDGNFLACLNTPRMALSPAEIRRRADEAFAQFLGMLETSAGWYATRRYGLAPGPSATGNQPDFAATAGAWALLAGDPRQLWEYLYCAYGDAFRGVCHHERDGTVLRAANHPRCTTWSGYPHSSGSDFLDKKRPVWGDRYATGWGAYDDEHRSQNMLAAVVAFSDDPIADELVEHFVEIDLMSHRHRTGVGDATRAQGRMAGAWAQLASVTGDSTVRTKLLELLARKRSISEGLLGQTDPSKPMRVLATIGPDPRKPIRDPATGQLMTTTSMWELGLAIVGYRLAHKRGEPVGDMLEILCRTIARYGTFQDGNAWPLVADVAWFGGDDHPVPLSRSSPYLILAGGSGVGGWVIAGMMVAAEILQDAEARDRARRCVGANTGGQEATDRQNAEWWAIVRSVADISTPL